MAWSTGGWNYFVAIPFRQFNALYSRFLSGKPSKYTVAIKMCMPKNVLATFSVGSRKKRKSIPRKFFLVLSPFPSFILQRCWRYTGNMPKFLNCFLTAVICSTSVLSPIYASFPYGSQKVRGVNLGGWLVLEVLKFFSSSLLTKKIHWPWIIQPWITPSIFDNTGDSRIVDEYTLGQYRKSDTLSTLQHHWDTWITESDFSAIAAAGWVLTPKKIDIRGA